MKRVVRIFKGLFVISVLVGTALSASAQEVETTKSCVVGVDCESGDFGLSDAAIEAYPTPNIQQVYPSDSIVFDRRYRRVTDATEFYDAPNGAVTDGLAAGFHFVTINTEEEGWARTANGRWLKSDFLSTSVPTSRYAGFHLPSEELPYPVAWLLVHTRPSLTPGAEPNPDYSVMLRYTTVNIYDRVDIDGWLWYQIGVDQWVQQTQVAMVIPVERFDDVDTERWISIDLYEQVLIAYEGETPVYAALISSGLAQWPTNEGLFHVYIRYPRTVMVGGYGQPDFYYLQEVPWTMYFDNDIGVHGAYWHDGFGYRRSHGCVNMSVADSRWLYEWANPEFDPKIPNDTGPAVYVYSSGIYR